MMLKEEILELLRTDRAFREEVRRQLLTEELLTLPERFDRLTELVGELIKAQQRQSEQIEELIEAQRRTEQGLQRQGEQIQTLVEAQRQHSGQIQALVEVQRRSEDKLQLLIHWRQGEDGRRRGERYERQVIRRAPFLFNGGQGGAPDEPWVRQRLTEQLEPLLEQEVDANDDPFLADLIWWKGERIAVVEVSYLVNGHDVERAAGRAETIRRTGAETMAIVMGKDWATEDTPGQAIHQHVEWYVGTSLSEGFIEFRRTPSS